MQKEIISLVMSELGKKSAVARKKKYGKSFGKRMAELRRGKTKKLSTSNGLQS